MPAVSTFVTKDKDGGGEVSVKEFDRAMRAAEKLPSRKEKQVPWKRDTEIPRNRPVAGAAELFVPDA